MKTLGLSLLGGLLVVLSSATANAQYDPKFAYGDGEPEPPPKTVAWAAQIKGGLLLAGGNAQATTASLSGNTSRRAGDNKLSLEGLVAYGETRNRVFGPVVNSDADITRDKVVSTNNANARGRYDRYFKDKNSAYAMGTIGQDKIAGKKLFGGGQIGYSRKLVQSDRHQLVSEIGYDFSYESYHVADARSVSIHSARIFAGETWKLTEDTGFYGNAEALFNLNNETNALDARVTTRRPGQPFPKEGVAAFKDIRVNAKTGLTTKLWENISFGFGVTLRYDQNPAPLAPPDGTMFGPDFRVFANTVDYLVDASLIVTLL